MEGIRKEDVGRLRPG